MTTDLSVERLDVYFGSVQALDAITFEVEGGSTFGIIGPNGAGKTSLLNAVCGLVRPAAGQVALRGRVITGLKPERIAALGVARSFQLAESFGDFSVWDYVRLGTAANRARTRAGHDERCVAAMESMELWPHRARRLRTLPYGLRKLVDVCRSTVSDPSILLLDEPTSGLSATERSEMGAHLGRLKATIATMLIVDHDVGFISSVSDRLYAIAYGKPLAQGSPTEVLQHPDVIAAYMG